MRRDIGAAWRARIPSGDEDQAFTRRPLLDLAPYPSPVITLFHIQAHKLSLSRESVDGMRISSIIGRISSFGTHGGLAGTVLIYVMLHQN